LSTLRATCFDTTTLFLGQNTWAVAMSCRVKTSGIWAYDVISSNIETGSPVPVCYPVF